ncbi:MAG: cysteine desulfurase NifS [Candidatus Zambryskibacteria bacterium CG10_big_fil_rev_8_21_14_0_10_34_34]|uniref:Cysteine desulfurase NifS n=1 Tax=Candidatus Zambryskibacteria bacterium CG10_big_fil_rev_8_21_14_0_10_34_34 TaxID=1975114 RepID=A0A2H0R1W0_9BACT|nr:MAG: cysteine desulfurase NifS [Candidatus Zambryskibacteria bacterium CG10_big_fil_rev_8_21_14_0_10_34_34]
MKNKEKRIFLDYAAITPVDLRVAKEMTKIQKDFWANPSSLHTEGERAKNMLEEARIRIARILHCKSSEVFFTASGTESLNIAILGVVKSQGQPFGTGAVQGLPLAFVSQRSSLKDFAPKGGPLIPHIIVSTIEHSAVLEPIKYLLKEGKAEVSFIAPNEKGIINPDSIKKEIKENTVLIAIQHANNEIGTIQPIQKIAGVIREYKQKNPRVALGQNYPYFLVDACQSVCYEDVSIEKLGADLLVLDGIKIYGPRGVGILVVKRVINIVPVMFGGGQEGGLRSGTENVIGAVGFAKALELARRGGEKESKRLTKLRDYAIKKILKEIPNTSLNGGLENRLPNNINICFQSIQGESLVRKEGLDSEFLVIKLDTLGFAVSAASACHSLSLENGSYVIEAIENARSTSSKSSKCSSSSLRITLGRNTKKSDLDSLISTLKKIVK